MALIVEDGSGLTTAESYISVADTDSYDAARIDSSDWQGLTTAQKELQLRKAARYVDALYRWIGKRANQNQALQFPRMELIDVDGYAFASNVIPQAIKDATAEMAIKGATEDINPDLDSDGALTSESVTVAVISVSNSYAGGSSPRKKYQTVADMLKRFAMSGTQITRA